MKLTGPFTQLLTMRNLPTKGALRDEQLEIIEQGGLVYDQGKILTVGIFEELKQEYKNAEIEHIDQDAVCLPGFIDCHTHIAFGGTRAQDFALRNAGATYLEIAKSGGGIWNTVQATRECDAETLAQHVVERAMHLLRQGITTIEVKSGYGLSVAEELKMLRAITQAKQYSPATLVTTCLAAHTFPRDFEGEKSDYLRYLLTDLLPVLQRDGLTNRIDAFIEESAFTPEEIRPYFEQASSMGFDITVHADQFTTGGSAIAIEFGAVSADHLEVSGEAEIKALAQSDVVAVALPGASLGVGCAFTPARQLLDAGAALAIATDWNPGSAPMGQLMVQASILATMQKLSNAEVLGALTFRAAKALRLQQKGCLDKGFDADFQVYFVGDYREITYQQGLLQPAKVAIKGTWLDV